jgi:glycosyltransferase involved in cell wall biosynthesis
MQQRQTRPIRPSSIRIAFVCGREPSYIRNRLLVRGLAVHHAVTVIASDAPTYPRRLAVVIPCLLRAARDADLIVAGFLGQPLALLAERALGRPVLLDAFVSVYDTLCLDRLTVAPGSLTGRLAFGLDAAAVRASRLTLVDTAGQRAFFARTFHASPERLLVHYLGPEEVNTQPESGQAERDGQPGATNERITVFHYSSYLPLHGVDTIVRAAAELQDCRHVRFRLVGRGREWPRVRALAQQLGLANVDFVDWLAPDALRAELASATIGLGGHFADNPKARRVIAGKTFQLLAAGLPTIVGDNPANRELFRPGGEVVAVPHAQPAALAAAIRQLATDPERRHALGAAGAALMRERFAPERVAEELRLAVDRALSSP